jgi:PAS domain S-box-containing protein
VAGTSDQTARIEIDARAFAETLAKTTESLVCVLDGGGRILAFNEASERATGFTADEVLGRDAREFVIPPEEAAAFGDVLDYVWATGHSSPQVGHWLRRDGARLLIAWSNKPVLDEHGEPLYLVTSGHDITAHEQVVAERQALAGDLEARLGEVAHLAQQQTALRRVATLVAAAETPERVFAKVSEQCARVLGTGAAAVFRYDGDETATVVGRFDREGINAFPLGSSVAIDRHSAIGLVRLTGQPAKIDDYSLLPGEVAARMRASGLRFTIAAPISVGGSIWGAVTVTSKVMDRIPAEGEARLSDFCELVSLAIASAEAREQLSASRARIVQAADEERRRLERNLHDGAQQRLVGLSLLIRLAQAQLRSSPKAASELLDRMAEDLAAALEELRELARGLHPGILSDRGLRSALEALADRAPLPVELVEAPDERLPQPVETAAYYIAAEALTNVAKHAAASCATIAVRRSDESVVLEITDDGRGGADPDTGSGMVGLRDRAEALGGLLLVDSPPGTGTTVRAVLPFGPY